MPNPHDPTIQVPEPQGDGRKYRDDGTEDLTAYGRETLGNYLEDITHNIGDSSRTTVAYNYYPIDNSAGVDCSDHEVNLKILLDDLLDKKKMTFDDRNKLLQKLSDNVCALVIKNNQLQNIILSLSLRLSKRRMGVSSMGFHHNAPALWMAKSIRPNRSTVSATPAATSSSLRTFIRTANASVPNASQASTVSPMVPGNVGCGVTVLAATATRTPSLANRNAMARPIPRPAPVTMATLPESSMMTSDRRLSGRRRGSTAFDSINTGQPPLSWAI